MKIIFFTYKHLVRLSINQEVFHQEKAKDYPNLEKEYLFDICVCVCQSVRHIKHNFYAKVKNPKPPNDHAYEALQILGYTQNLLRWKILGSLE